MRSSYIKTKSDEDYTITMSSTFNLLKSKLNYSARITNIYELLKISFGLDEFSMLNYQYMDGPSIESWIIDKFIDWKNNNPIDFIEIYKYLVNSAVEFDIEELKLFEDGLVEERLWAIFKFVDTPDLII